MATSLRIVHCFRAPVGGVFRHVRDLAAAQAAAGHEVGMICDSLTGGALDDSLLDAIGGRLSLGVARLPIPRSVGPGDIAAGRRAYGLIKALRPDVLHGHGAKGGVIARLFGSLLRVSRYRVARLYSPHGGVLHYDPATRRGRALFSVERLMGRFTDHLLFVSDHERQSYFDKVGTPRTAFSVVHNGLGPEDFVAVPPAPGAADLLYVGTMRDLKGTDIFIDAMAEAETRLGRALTAVMVGDCDDLSRYEAQARERGLARRIRFLDPMPARAAFALGRVVVVPSRAEGLPYIVLEALAAGKTTIATAVGGIPEILPPGSPALAAPSVEGVAAAMAAAMADEAGFSAHMPPREELRARFGADAMAASIEKAYLASLGRTGN